VEDIKQPYPYLNLEDKVGSRGEGIVTVLHKGTRQRRLLGHLNLKVQGTARRIYY